MAWSTAPEGPARAALGGAVKGMYTGLVLGLLYGVWEEKKFVLRNCVKEYHLRECATQLFGITRRGATTAPVVATFMGCHAGMRCWWHRRQSQQQGGRGPVEPQSEPEPLGSLPPLDQPVIAGVAGTLAGGVRTLLAEAALTMHPLIHAQRAAGAGLAAAGVFALGGCLEREQQRQREQEGQEGPWLD